MTLKKKEATEWGWEGFEEGRNVNDYITNPPSRKGTTPKLNLKKKYCIYRYLVFFWSEKFRIVSFMATRGCCGTGSLI